MSDWKKDRGRDWGDGEFRFAYWLSLRADGSEWDARAIVPYDILVTLEHGETYTAAELGIEEEMPEKLQFRVERLIDYAYPPTH